MGLKIESYTKDIAAATTPEDLVKDGGGVQQAQEIHISCPSGNTDDLLLGSRDSQDVVIPKGTTKVLTGLQNKMSYNDTFDLKEVFVKAGTNGDSAGIMIVYREV